MPGSDLVEPVYRKVGRAVARARRQADMTQRELGKRIGMSREGIASIEAGRQRVFIHTLLDIVEQLPHIGAIKYDIQRQK